VGGSTDITSSSEFSSGNSNYPRLGCSHGTEEEGSWSGDGVRSGDESATMISLILWFLPVAPSRLTSDVEPGFRGRE